MVRVTTCSECDAQVALPEEAETGATLLCPTCFASFALEASRTTELRQATIVPPVEEIAPAPAPMEMPADSPGSLPIESPVESLGDSAPAPTAAPADDPPAERPAPRPGMATIDFSAPRDPNLSSLLDQLRDAPSTDESADASESATTSPPEEPSRAPTIAEAASSAFDFSAGYAYADDNANDDNADQQAPTTPAAVTVEEPTPAPQALVEESPQEETVSASGTARSRGTWGLARAVAISAGVLVGVTGGYGLLVGIGGPQYDSLGVLAMTADDASETSAEPAPGDFAAPEYQPGAGEPAIDEMAIDEMANEDPAFDEPEAFSPSGAIEPATYEAPADTAAEFEEYRPTPLPPLQQFDAPAAMSEGLTTPEQPAFTPEPSIPALAPPMPAVLDAPEFSPSQLAEAVVGAEQAAVELTENSIADGGDLELIGRAYAKLCEAAHVLTFASLDVPRSDTGAAVAEVEGLFAEIFRHAHAQADSRQVAERWLAWDARPHGGLFFAGPLPEPTNAGSVYEYRFALGQQEVVVLTPDLITAEAGTQVGVVGSLIERPAERIDGYLGDAPQAVWLSAATPAP